MPAHTMETCPTCNGSGWNRRQAAPYDRILCGQCGGRKQVPVDRPTALDSMARVLRKKR